MAVASKSCYNKIIKHPKNMKKKTTKTKDCLVCNRIKDIKKDKNPYFVKELKTGYVVIGDHQYFEGYTLFLCKEHKDELHELNPKFRQKFLWEMSIVAEAVFKAFKPKKINYELLGNTDNHMHWHIFPRHTDDPLPNRTIWNINKKTRQSKSTIPNKTELNRLKIKLEKELNKLLKKSQKLGKRKD